MAAKKINLIEALQAATAEDLADIDARITAVRDKIEATLRAQRGELDALLAARKLIDLRINGRPSKAVKGAAKKGASPADGGGSELACAIHDLLTKEGSLPVAAIAQRLGKTNAAIGVCVARSSWFSRTSDGDVQIARAS